MANVIDENGLKIDRFDESRQEIADDLKVKWGDGTKTASESVNGQIIDPVAERTSDQNELAELVASIWNPNAVKGVFQSQLVKVNGITRNEAIKSTVALNVVANASGSEIPAGYAVSDPLVGEPFLIDSAVSLAPSESKTVSATAKNDGAIEAPAGTLTKIENANFGWASVSNPSDASIGNKEESDTDLRIRRDVAASQTGTANASAMYTVLNDFDSVDYAQVYENKSNITDSRGIPARTLWPVVSGGSDEEIAALIYSKLPAGTDTFGAVTVSYADPITGQVYDINFSRPTEVPIFVSYELNKNAGYPSNGDDLIIERTVQFFEGEFYLNSVLIPGFVLGEDVVASRLYTPANTVLGHSIAAVRIGKTANPSTSTTVDIAPDEIAGVDSTTIGVV